MISAGDFRNGITSQDYPSQIANDSDSKALKELHSSEPS